MRYDIITTDHTKFQSVPFSNQNVKIAQIQINYCNSKLQTEIIISLGNCISYNKMFLF